MPTATTAEDAPAVPVTDKLRAEVEAAGADYQAATAARAAAITRAKKAAQKAFAAGMTQAEIARLLGVDRARTVRYWLGIEERNS